MIDGCWGAGGDDVDTEGGRGGGGGGEVDTLIGVEVKGAS